MVNDNFIHFSEDDPMPEIHKGDYDLLERLRDDPNRDPEEYAQVTDRVCNYMDWLERHNII